MPAAVKPPAREIIGWELIRSCKLPDEIVSENEYTGGYGPFSKASRRHWRDTKTWGFLLRSMDGLGFVIPHDNEKRRVDIIRVMHAGQRQWDTENTYGGTVKSVNDALVDLGWLKDDNPFWRELSLIQMRWSDLSPKLLAEYERKRFSTVISILRPVYQPEVWPR